MIKLITPNDGTYLFTCESSAQLAAKIFVMNRTYFLNEYKTNKVKKK